MGDNLAREPLRLTEQLLAAHRPGALVALAIGAAAGIPRTQPRIARTVPGAVASGALGFAHHLGDVARARFLTSRGYAVAQVANTNARGALPPPAPGTAVVAIRGVIEQRADAWSCGQTTGYDLIEADICEALCDPGVGSLVIDCDSPGGDVPGLEETTARIRAVADDIGKPVLGFYNEFGASAAVYLMLGVCDTTYLPRSGRVGSVSSAVIFASEHRRLEQDGTDVYVARGLPGKMNPNPLEALDELGKKRLDDLALECSERFIAFVSERCGIDPQVIRSWNAAIFTGAAVVDAGLADGIGTLDQIIALAGELAGSQEAA